MGCIGILFSLDEKTVKKLKSLKSDEARLEYLEEDLEEEVLTNHPEQVADLDKSWDAMHRCLTDGKLEWKNGTFPLSHVILGGEHIYQEDDYIMILKLPQEVKQIAEAVVKVTREEFRENYNKIDPEIYGYDLTDEDFDYTWDNFNESLAFWQKAATRNRYVLFTAEQ